MQNILFNIWNYMSCHWTWKSWNSIEFESGAWKTWNNLKLCRFFRAEFGIIMFTKLCFPK